MDKALVMILAGGEVGELLTLTNVRAKAAVPFGGQYRIIDFCLSNCVNSGLTDICVLAQYFPESLKSHIGSGKPWDLDRRTGGVRVLEPYETARDFRWYRGGADALIQNADVIAGKKYPNVIVLAGDHIYKMDYRLLLAAHENSRAPITIAVGVAKPEKPASYASAVLRDDGYVLSFDKNNSTSSLDMATMGVYVFNTPFLLDKLREIVNTGAVDIITDIIAPEAVKGNVFTYYFNGYWDDVVNVEDYYHANVRLLSDKPGVRSLDSRWPIYTRQNDDPPVKTGPDAVISNSFIASGAIINGEVVNSMVFSRVYIEKSASVRDSIILSGTHIGPDSSVDRAIVDKLVTIGQGSRVGWGDDYSPNQDYPDQLNSGITLVGKRTKIPPGFIVGRNCLIDILLDYSDFERCTGNALPAGANILLPGA